MLSVSHHPHEPHHKKKKLKKKLNDDRRRFRSTYATYARIYTPLPSMFFFQKHTRLSMFLRMLTTSPFFFLRMFTEYVTEYVQLAIQK